MCELHNTSLYDVFRWFKSGPFNIIFYYYYYYYYFLLTKRVHKEMSHRDDYNSLVSEYLAVIEATSGVGTRGQHYIDTAYARLQSFVSRHPEFKNDFDIRFKMPVCCSNGGFHGFAHALGNYPH